MGLRAVLAMAAVMQAGMVQASIDPCYADYSVARATDVIQIINFTVSEPDAMRHCTVSGEVARVFRGRQCDVGDKVSPMVTCTGDPEELCGSGWYDPESIMAAGAIEIHVEREGDMPAGIESVLLLDALTDEIVWRSACGN